MGQCKSKTNALEDNGVAEDDDAEVKEKKLSRRKWRKRKGYSLSASVERDLNRQLDQRESKTGKDGLVLVSYNVTKSEDDIHSSLCDHHRLKSSLARSCQLSPIIDNDDDDGAEEITEEKADMRVENDQTEDDANDDELRGSGTLDTQNTSYQLESRKNVEPPQNLDTAVAVKTLEESQVSNSSNCLEKADSSVWCNDNHAESGLSVIDECENVELNDAKDNAEPRDNLEENNDEVVSSFLNVNDNICPPDQTEKSPDIKESSDLDQQPPNSESVSDILQSSTDKHDPVTKTKAKVHFEEVELSRSSPKLLPLPVPSGISSIIESGSASVMFLDSSLSTPPSVNIPKHASSDDNDDVGEGVATADENATVQCENNDSTLQHDDENDTNDNSEPPSSGSDPAESCFVQTQDNDRSAEEDNDTIDNTNHDDNEDEITPASRQHVSVVEIREDNRNESDDPRSVTSAVVTVKDLKADNDDDDDKSKASFITVDELRKMFAAKEAVREVGVKSVENVKTVICNTNEKQDVTETRDKPGDEALNGVKRRADKETTAKDDNNSDKLIMNGNDRAENVDDDENGNLASLDITTVLVNDVNEGVECGRVCDSGAGDKIISEPGVKPDNEDTDPVSDVTHNADDPGNCCETLQNIVDETLEEKRKLSAEIRIIKNTEDEEEVSEDSSMTSTLSDEDETCQEATLPVSFSLSTDAEYDAGHYLARLDPDHHHLQLNSLPEMFVDEEASTLSDVSPIEECEVLIGQDAVTSSVIGQDDVSKTGQDNVSCDSSEKCDNSGQDNVIVRSENNNTRPEPLTDPHINNNNHQRVNHSEEEIIKHSSITFISGPSSSSTRKLLIRMKLVTRLLMPHFNSVICIIIIC